ncbi:MAG: hypothetical protein KIT16_22175, partial [Rhodospirillaceae bacterium]|nr:hypothetical protein [Rhodospirillaceae bacterium]
MRNVFVLAIAATFALPAAAQAQQTGHSSTEVARADGETRLDTLFSELKRARNERAAERISQRIWREWARSGSASIDLLMQWSQKAVDEKNYDVAMDLLDEVVTIAPDFAEGWNRRATLHFAMNSDAKSMTDSSRALEIEPRHFGALGGMATILKNSG